MMAQWRSRMNALPKIPPEDSILLRVLVQTLVIIGIVATDIAAADVTDRLNLIAWAVPASIIGATISYLRRRKRNVGIKFMIAIGMFIALGYFFVNLLSRSNDTRLVLVELLIQLQVLHSLDLPRRKDLGYSMMIGLILISVSATLSQTLMFGPFLLAFLAIAIPVLILDYSARIGIRPEKGQRGLKSLFKLSPELSPKRLLLLLVAVTTLGLSVFALLPRLPGYQLRTFPVSAPMDVQGKFDNRQVFNPGYVTNPDAEGEGEGAGGTGAQLGEGSPTTGPGEADDEYYYGFNTVMNQNLRGQVTPKLVMRVRSQVEGFWRVMAFDKYTGQGWEVSQNENTNTLRRPVWSYRFLVPRTLLRRRQREVIQTYTMVADLPNLIPALDEPSELYFPTEEVALDVEGGLRSPVPLTEGTTYTVVSRVPYRDRAVLAAAGQDYPGTLSRRYFEVPPELQPVLKAKAAELLAQASSEITSPYEQALYLTQALKQRYQIQPNLPFFGENEDLVLAFLNQHQGGYPDHFSTTLTLMLRSMGIPARLAVGFGPGEFNPFTGLYLVKNSDAYALTEAYFPGQGWFMFDPIPGHALYPPSVEDSAVFGLIKRFWQWVAGWLPSPLRNGLNAVFAFIGMVLGQTIGRLLGLLSADVVGLFTGLVLLTLLAFGGWLSLGWWRRWQRQRWLVKQPPMEQAYLQMLSCFAKQGIVKTVAQTPFEYASQLQEHCAADPALWAQGITRAYVEWRYGDLEPDMAAVEQQREMLERYFRQLQKPKA